MDSPAAVFAIVLLELAVGGLVLLWVAPTWGAVRHGYEIVLSTTLGLIALGAWAALPVPPAVAGAHVAAAWAGRGVLVTAALALTAALLLALGAASLGRAAGTLATVAGVATFLPVAQLRAAAGGPPGGFGFGVAELALGAFFLGAVWDGMVLGHWYLVERRLSNRYMMWVARVNVAAVVAGFLAVVLSARNPLPCAGLSGAALVRCSLNYSPILSIGGFTVMMGLGLVVLVAFIAALNLRLAREGGRSIQASTGMFYLAVILAPAAEFAAKVRFF